MLAAVALSRVDRRYTAIARDLITVAGFLVAAREPSKDDAM